MVAAGSLEESQNALALVRKHQAPGAPKLFSTVGVHPTRCSEFENNSLDNDPDKYFAELAAVCEEGARDGAVRGCAAV